MRQNEMVMLVTVVLVLAISLSIVWSAQHDRRWHAPMDGTCHPGSVARAWEDAENGSDPYVIHDGVEFLTQCAAEALEEFEPAASAYEVSR